MGKSNIVNRRNFIRMAALGGTGMILPHSSIASVESIVGISAKKIEQRKLGKTGIKVPVLSMGVMKADNPNLIKAAMKSGIYYFDTANGYQNGKNEEMLGKVFKETPRDKFIVATKINLGRDIFNENAPEVFRKKFDESMQRLGIPYVDILYLHAISDTKAALHQPILEVMQSLKKEGRVKHLGISTHSNIPAIIDAAISSGVYEIVLNSYNFRQKDAKEIDEAMERANKAGLGIVAMKVMAGGKDINAGACLKWAMKNKHVHTTIPGFTTYDQLEECLTAATDRKLSKEENQFLAEADSIPSLYCQNCKKCDGQCPKGLPIPELMRAYMYNFGYKHAILAKELVDTLDITTNPCGDCSNCTVKCVSGFDVAAKINAIAPIKEVSESFLA